MSSAAPRRLPLSLDTIILLVITSSLTRLAMMTRLVPVPIEPTGLRSDNEYITKWLVLSLMILGVMIYVIADIASQVSSNERMQRWVTLTKWIVVVYLVTIFEITATLSFISLRQQQGPATHIHDGAIQVEEAIKLLLSGRNFYGFDYSSTPMKDWLPNWDNPGLYHFVYLPFVTLFSVPFHVSSHALLGWYDQRFVYLFCVAGCLVALPFLARSSSAKLSAVMIGLLNPNLVMYIPEGRNDIFTLFWIVLGVLCLQRSRLILGCVFIGLACASKQSAWPMVPFLLAYLWWMRPQVSTQTSNLWQRVRLRFPWKPFAAMAIPFALLIIPFLAWDFRAFVDDTIRYQTGTVEHSYPIRGSATYGVGNLLLYGRWARSDERLSSGAYLESEDYFPFWTFQLLLGAPVFLLLLTWQKRGNSMGRMLTSYGLLLLLLQYFSRSFNDNYWGYIVAVVGLGILLEGEAAGEPGSAGASPSRN